MNLSDAYAGMQVRCVDASETFNQLALGGVYTIESVDLEYVSINGTLWDSSSFEPVAEPPVPPPATEEPLRHENARVGMRVRCVEEDRTRELFNDSLHTLTEINGYPTTTVRIDSNEYWFRADRFMVISAPSAASPAPTQGDPVFRLLQSENPPPATPAPSTEATDKQRWDALMSGYNKIMSGLARFPVAVNAPLFDSFKDRWLAGESNTQSHLLLPSLAYYLEYEGYCTINQAREWLNAQYGLANISQPTTSNSNTLLLSAIQRIGITPADF